MLQNQLNTIWKRTKRPSADIENDPSVAVLRHSEGETPSVEKPSEKPEKEPVVEKPKSKPRLAINFANAKK